MGANTAYASEWAVDVVLLIGVICGLVISVGVTWILFKVGNVLDKLS